MITNNTEFLQMVILSMADEKYQEDIKNTFMENSTIGPNLDWESKEAWISDYIIEHFNNVKKSIIDKDDKKGFKQIVTYENTIAMRMYSLDVGQSFDLDNFTRIIRYPGGWCMQLSANNVTRVIFIPLDNEFNVKDGLLKKEFAKIMGTEKISDDTFKVVQDAWKP